MPAWRLDEEERKIAQYDVGTVDGLGTHFIEHVLLCGAEQPASVSENSSSIPAIHMGPPLVEDQVEEIHAIATAELDVFEISKGERRQIKVFVDDLLLELESQNKIPQYTIHPAVREPDKDHPHRRFNCAGFVLNAYLEAGIDLIEQNHVPEVTLDVLKTAYPAVGPLLDRDHFRERMGIGEGNKWPVILAGYVINSLNRSAEDIRNLPYSPRQGDEFFPAQPPTSND